MEEEKQIIASMKKIKDGLRIILTQSYVDDSFIRDKEKLKEFLIALMSTMFGVATLTGIEMDEVEELVNMAIVEKKPVERMKRHAIAIGDFLENGFTVLTGSPEEMLAIGSLY